MRPGTVGAVVRVPLSLSATSSLIAQNNVPRRLEVALPGGRSVTCEVRPVARRQNMVVLAGAPVAGGEAEQCNLVVRNGQVTGEIDLESGRYRIQPIGAGATHAVVEVKTENLPDELAPKIPNEPMPQRAAADTAQCDVKPAPGQQAKTFGPHPDHVPLHQGGCGWCAEHPRRHRAASCSSCGPASARTGWAAISL
mgnify:CR=1 FL=1